MGRNLNALIISTLAITMTAVSPIYARGENNRGQRDQSPRYGSDFGRDYDNGRGRHQPSQPKEVSETIYIGEEVSGVTLMKVRQKFGGLKEFKGMEFKSLEFNIDGVRKGGEAMLLVDGQKVDTIKTFKGRRFGEQKIKWQPKRIFTLGDTMKNLQVQFSGAAFVQSATVTFKEKEEPRHQGPQYFTVSESFYGQNEKSIASLIHADFKEYNSDVSRVIVKVKSYDRRGARAHIKLCAGYKCSQSQMIFGAGEQSLIFKVPSHQAKLGELTLETQGAFVLMEIVAFP